MKRIVSILLCIVLLMGNMVFAENESLTVLDVESFNAGIGEAVSYSLTRYSQSGVEEIDEYEAICDAQGIVIDKVYKTITSEKPGIYDITISAKDWFSEKIKLAVNDNKKEQIAKRGYLLFLCRFGRVPKTGLSPHKLADQSIRGENVGVHGG